MFVYVHSGECMFVFVSICICIVFLKINVDIVFVESGQVTEGELAQNFSAIYKTLALEF